MSNKKLSKRDMLSKYCTKFKRTRKFNDISIIFLFLCTMIIISLIIYVVFSKNTGIVPSYISLPLALFMATYAFINLFTWYLEGVYVTKISEIIKSDLNNICSKYFTGPEYFIESLKFVYKIYLSDEKTLPMTDYMNFKNDINSYFNDINNRFIGLKFKYKAYVTWPLGECTQIDNFK